MTTPVSLTVNLMAPYTANGAVISEFGSPDWVSEPLKAQSFRVQTWTLSLWNASTSTWEFGASGTGIGPYRVIKFAVTHPNITKAKLEMTNDLNVLHPVRIAEFHLTP